MTVDAVLGWTSQGNYVNQLEKPRPYLYACMTFTVDPEFIIVIIYGLFYSHTADYVSARKPSSGGCVHVVNCVDCNL